MQLRPVQPQVSFPELEQRRLERWDEQRIFERTLSERDPARSYVFYDGPPFATGLPHYGHLVASILKDTIPRYWTMRGFHVERRWGWDCHGLPVENETEKDLGLKEKRDIEKFGVHDFNEACRSIVLRFTKEWEKTIRKLGRWADFEGGYRTMDRDFMESVWWVFRQLWDKELIYSGFRIQPYCPRCGDAALELRAQPAGRLRRPPGPEHHGPRRARGAGRRRALAVDHDALDAAGEHGRGRCRGRRLRRGRAAGAQRDPGRGACRALLRRRGPRRATLQGRRPAGPALPAAVRLPGAGERAPVHGPGR